MTLIQRYLSLDLGNRRIGLATGGPLGVPVVPVGYVERGTLRNDVDRVLSAAKERDVSGIVVGIPYLLSGEVGEQARLAQGFIRALRRSSEIPVFTVDERYTSAEAEGLLREAGNQPSRSRGAVDATAAVLILERFLLKNEDYR